MVNLSRTVEIFDPTQHRTDTKISDEHRYNCPNCISKRGKADNNGKLYWNVTKERGYCFKCNTAFFPQEVEGAPNTELKIAAESNEALKDDPYEEPASISFDFPELDTDLLKYLKGRNPFLLQLKESLGLHGWYGTDKGVVTPFAYKGNIVKFQTRFTTRKGTKKAKYYTSKGIKVLYSPYNIFAPSDLDLIGADEITLCEGTYDAIALAIMGLPCPLAVLGSSLTPFQRRQVECLAPEKVFLCMDNWDISLALAKQVKREVSSVAKTEIQVPWQRDKSDPEELMVSLVKTVPEFLTSCMKNVEEWLNETTK
jgi:hypothetical protein